MGSQGLTTGVYHWFPKMFGRMLNKNLGYIHFWVTAICAYGVFFPMHFIGMAGLPRRYYTNSNFPLFDDTSNVQILITVFALVGGVFQLVFLWNFFHSIFYGKKRSIRNIVSQGVACNDIKHDFAKSNYFFHFINLFY